ncbi:MAG TPA: MFS transporter, partial [Mycobacteriales bacterium]|nr:MFS transporter [Mycobacteriales bacterium]
CGAAVLVAAFALLRAGDRGSRGSRIWLAAAVFGSAVGPALGGALTQLLDWRAIFFVQAPIVAIAGLLSLLAPAAPSVPAGSTSVRDWISARALCLALLSAALTGVLFLLVLLLISGWALSPLTAAGVVTVLPVAALLGTLVRAPDRERAIAGCLLVGAGVLCLAFMPLDSIGLTMAPQAVAGLGMGMALPALAGGLLPERNSEQSARLLCVRHLGMTLALVIIAPIASAELNHAVDDVKEKGIALFLDAKLPPLQKLDLAQVATADLKTVAPRSELKKALNKGRSDIDSGDRTEYDSVRAEADHTLVAAVNSAFRPAFLICGALALFAAVILFLAGRLRAGPLLIGSVVAAGALLAGQLTAAAGTKTPHVVIADPCQKRDLPHTGGISGFLQDKALQLLDEKACDYGSSREALALAIASPKESADYAKKYGVDPRKKLAPLIKLLNALRN